MILLLRINGQDQVEILVSDGEGFMLLAEYVFAKDHSHLLLKTVEDALQGHGRSMEEVAGVLVQWGDNMRFTVSRIVGIIANSLGWSLQVSVAACSADMSEEQMLAALATARTQGAHQILIQYSGDPTITLPE